MKSGPQAGKRDDGSLATRRLLIFVAFSVVLHLLLTAALLVVPDLLQFSQGKSLPRDVPLASVEFLLVQQEGFGQPTAPDTPAKPAPAAAPQQQQQPQPQPPRPEDPAAEAASPPPSQPAPPESAPPESGATPAPEAPPAPKINLGGTDSLSSLIATGEQLIPAAIDAKFRNREPVYPKEAARLGQHGLVVVRAHVAPDGHAEAVDIEQSSGYPLLDNAARDAILTWHFRSAIESGVPVRSTLSIAVEFALR